MREREIRKFASVFFTDLERFFCDCQEDGHEDLELSTSLLHTKNRVAKLPGVRGTERQREQRQREGRGGEVRGKREDKYSTKIRRRSG